MNTKTFRDFMRVKASVLMVLLLLTPCLASIFKVDNSITISNSEIINENAYLMGNLVTVDGTINGDLMAGARTLTINGNITGDVRGVAVTVIINGNVDGELAIGAGQIQLSEGASVGEINAMAESLLIGGAVLGNVSATITSLTVTDTSSIGGYLNYTSSNDAIISNQDVIVGLVQKNEATDWSGWSAPGIDWLWGFNIFTVVICVLTELLMGYVLIKVSEKNVKGLQKRMDKNVFNQIVKGFAVLILVPVAAIIGMITIIAAPLSLIGLALYAIMLYIASVITAFYIGMKTLRWLKAKKQSLMIELLVGILVIELIKLIPFAGWFISLVIWLLSIGAITNHVKASFEECKKKKIC